MIALLLIGWAAWTLLLVALVIEAIARRVSAPVEYADRSRGYRGSHD